MKKKIYKVVDLILIITITILLGSTIYDINKLNKLVKQVEYEYNIHQFNK